MMNNNPFDLTGKIALITGASKGIGASIARAFALQGATVVVSSRQFENVATVADALKAEGLNAYAIACHVGELQQLNGMVGEVTQLLGGIDILVNNAATNPVFGPLESADAGIFDKIMNVNVKAPWILANLCLPSMKERGGGSIINISSVEGLQAGMGLGLYSTSKAALIMLTKNQATEWGKFGIRSNAICPGLIKTKFSAALWQNEQWTRQLIESLPSGRIGMPEDIEGLALLLASQAGDYLTGGVYVADGGYLLTH
ncbi:MAG: glucose 1-dehydrogenase [Saprospiraceae bacterium]